MSRAPHPFPVLFLGWLVPGGGHVLLGKWTQAIVFFLVITITYFGGMYLADFTNVSLERHGYYYIAQILNGGETLLASLLTKDLQPTRVPQHLGTPTLEVGMLYTAVASLLNVIVVMNAYGEVLRRRSPEEEADAGEQVANGEAGA